MAVKKKIINIRVYFDGDQDAKEVFAEAEPDDTMRNLMIECNQAMTETIQKKIQLVRF